VVGDFRQADIALGHEGAPITVAAMRRLFATPDESRLIVNIGGMANYFFFPARRSGLKPAAADCGPGNSLSDILSQRWFGERFDRNGRRASSGRVHQKLLTRLWAEPFFNRPEKSTGRESFGVGLADRIIAYARKYGLARHDVMATTAELTVAAIAHQVRRFVRGGEGLSKLYLTGGGWRNKFFRRRLGEYFDGVEICTVVELGFDPDLVEAAAYAVMAEACVRSEAMPAVLGRPRNKVRQPVLGRLVQPARME
jgi:anhydro-N-acetylmuramic acid kinase